MELEIYDKDGYRQELINHYTNILEGRFLNLNPCEMTEEDLMNSIPIGIIEKSSIWDINNSLCWLYIGESFMDEYNGVSFKYVNFHSDRDINAGNIAMSLNYSQLKYPLSPLTDDSVFPVYNEHGILMRATIDDDIIEPESFFISSRVGERILYLGHLPGVTKYGKEKNCVDFAYRNLSPSHIRKYVVEHQIYYLRFLSRFPAVTIPDVAEKVVVDGEIKKVMPKLKPFVLWNLLKKFSPKCFRKE